MVSVAIRLFPPASACLLFAYCSQCKMSSKRLDAISDYARHGYNLRVACADCAHVAVLNARELTQQCVERGLSRDMGQLSDRLKCRKCGSRRVITGPTFGH